MNIPEFSVSEFSRSIKRLVEDAFGYVRIKGEITGLKTHKSGHLYFSLQEDEAVISAVCFKNLASLIDFKVENGLEVVASGKVTTYGGRSNYQIIVEKLEIAGIGAILEKIEKRRQKLQSEGLFDNNHKKSLPFFPKKIAVITSKTGAVIEDIKHRIKDRFPLNLAIYPSAVQGVNAITGIISGIKYFNSLSYEKRPDLIIIARGGGSFEDLLPFNDEEIVRAVFESQIPIISAIGHETDTTLIDYVADLRAPTPSAAAEMATPLIKELKLNLSNINKNLTTTTKANLCEMSSKPDNLKRLLLSPQKYLDQINEKIRISLKIINDTVVSKINYDCKKMESLKIPKSILINNLDRNLQYGKNLSKNINSFVAESLFRKAQSLLSLNKLLQNNDYKNTLKRGFALVKNGNNIITSVKDVSAESKINIELSDGNLSARILDKKAPELF